MISAQVESLFLAQRSARVQTMATVYLQDCKRKIFFVHSKDSRNCVHVLAMFGKPNRILTFCKYLKIRFCNKKSRKMYLFWCMNDMYIWVLEQRGNWGVCPGPHISQKSICSSPTQMSIPVATAENGTYCQDQASNAILSKFQWACAKFPTLLLLIVFLFNDFEDEHTLQKIFLDILSFVILFWY